MGKKKMIAAAVAGLLAVGLLAVFAPQKRAQKTYYAHRGSVFGTYYNIQYEAEAELLDSIKATFEKFDHSLSMFNEQSVISAINQNRDTVVDGYFEDMFTEAEKVYKQSEGAFDITIAPMVNLWGFGFKNRGEVTKEKVDSLLEVVGFEKLRFANKKVEKADERMMLDASAVAKGQGCDVIASLLARRGCENYIVDIGGEVVAKGVNKKGEGWRIGITKPVDDPSGESKELQDIIQSKDICMATSGNYRNFYYEGTQRRSHTIDPRTGYPVQHNLLSATVVASTCMRADALATACMVLGDTLALEMIEKSEDGAAYLIVAEGDSMVVRTTKNWEKVVKP